MKYATLRLSDKNDHNKYYDLKFRLNDNNFVRKWIGCVLEAQQKQCPISEPWAIYNLNNSLNGEFIKNKLNKLMKQVDEVHELFGFQLDDISDQDKLNKIHAIFEEQHGKLDEWLTNPLFKGKPDSFRKNLSEINQFVHACESNQGSPKIRLVWFDLPKTRMFTDEDYELFTNKKTFGSLYHGYSDVGKNIEALSEDNDDHHHDMVPNLHFSADCVIWFCDDTPEKVRHKEEAIKKYLDTHSKFIMSKGYTLDDKKLTTGRIEIGQIETELSKEQLLQELKEYNYIQSFFIS